MLTYLPTQLGESFQHLMSSCCYEIIYDYFGVFLKFTFDKIKV